MKACSIKIFPFLEKKLFACILELIHDASVSQPEQWLVLDLPTSSFSMCSIFVKFYHRLETFDTLENHLRDLCQESFYRTSTPDFGHLQRSFLSSVAKFNSKTLHKLASNRIATSSTTTFAICFPGGQECITRTGLLSFTYFFL